MHLRVVQSGHHANHPLVMPTLVTLPAHSTVLMWLSRTKVHVGHFTALAITNFTCEFNLHACDDPFLPEQSAAVAHARSDLENGTFGQVLQNPSTLATTLVSTVVVEADVWIMPRFARSLLGTNDVDRLVAKPYHALTSACNTSLHAPYRASTASEARFVSGILWNGRGINAPNTISRASWWGVNFAVPIAVA